MTEKKEIKTFSTKDMHLAATFITLGFQLIGITYQTEGTKPFPVGYFEFAETPELMKVEKAFPELIPMIRANRNFNSWPGEKLINCAMFVLLAKLLRISSL